jgi:hypothetical protein
MSTTPATPTPGSARRPSASARRARYGLTSLAVLVCAAISLVLANLIALDPRLHLAADVTATGEHRLAPRTRQVLGALPPGYEIVISGAGAADPGVRRRVADVLDAMARTGRLTVTWIDDPAGPQYAALIDRLIERDREAIQTAADDLHAFADEIDRAAARFEESDTALTAIGAAMPAASVEGRNQVGSYAAIARLQASDARQAARTIRETIGQANALGVPPLDRAISVARRALERLSTEMQGLSAALSALAAAEATPREAQIRARDLGRQVMLARDPVAVAAERAAAVAVPDLVRVSRVLEGAQSVLVVAPGALGAVSFEMVFPESIPQTVGGARADVGARAEDLITSAVSSLASPASPIVVLMHAEDHSLLEQDFVTQLQARLALRRIDLVEWRVVLEQEPPGLAAIDPTGTRPVVYATVPATSAAPSYGPSNLGGVERVQRLGAALQRLADRGLPILVSVTPSTLPGFGSQDAGVAFLRGFGLAADSGRPLLTERVVGGRRAVETDRVVTAIAPAAGDGAPTPHPIADAVQSLAIGLRWAIPIQIVDPPEGIRATAAPLIQIGTPQTWGEAQWLNFWQIPAEQRHLSPQPPLPDAAAGDDLAGPWTVAVAAERAMPGLPTQRIVVVGANGWFFDALAAQTEVVNGRVSLTLPGNAELFEAAVYWLAGQENLIARSAASGSVPTVRALTPGQLSIIGWLVLAGLPLGTLAAGVVWRVARG